MEQYRKNIYLALKPGVDISNLTVNSYLDYIPYADALGVSDDENGDLITDVINNKIYTLAEFMNRGYFYVQGSCWRMAGLNSEIKSRDMSEGNSAYHFHQFGVKAEVDPEGYDPNGKNISEEVLVLMKEKCQLYTNVKKMYDTDGLCIFAFEGLGKNMIGISRGVGNLKLFPTGRYGAMMVATIGNKVVFVTKNASTLPAVLKTKNKLGYKGTAVSDDGIYYIYSRKHQGLYAAFGTKTEDKTNDKIRVTRTCVCDNETVRVEDEANGVNIHTAPVFVGDLYSTACHTIHPTDYIPFLIATGCVSEDDPMAKILLKKSYIISSLQFRGQNAYPDENQTEWEDENGEKYSRDKYGIKLFSELNNQDAVDETYNTRINWCEKKMIDYGVYDNVTNAESDYYYFIELLGGMLKKNVNGYYVVDRSFMDSDQKKVFYLDKEPKSDCNCIK